VLRHSCGGNDHTMGRPIGTAGEGQAPTPHARRASGGEAAVTASREATSTNPASPPEVANATSSASSNASPASPSPATKRLTAYDHTNLIDLSGQGSLPRAHEPTDFEPGVAIALITRREL
jgi:hypothetical protein